MWVIRNIRAKLRFAALVSTLWAASVSAHEVFPAIADLELRDGHVRLSLELNLESYLSGIDLDGLADTSDVEGDTRYDSLRAMAPQQLEGGVAGLLARWNAVPLLQAGQNPLALTPESITIPEIGNTELPRLSEITLTAPVSDHVVLVTWPKGAGDLVLRQQGVDAPYTGYLSGGGTSPELVFPSGRGWSDAFRDFFDWF